MVVLLLLLLLLLFVTLVGSGGEVKGPIDTFAPATVMAAVAVAMAFVILFRGGSCVIVEPLIGCRTATCSLRFLCHHL
uniref:Secreted protein n=1 Tax=Anopheles darlingi TaxID=43151 RepID=A0A2M4D528_ANODA